MRRFFRKIKSLVLSQNFEFFFIRKRICANLYKSVKICTNLHKPVQICTSLYKSVQICTNQICANLNKICKNLWNTMLKSHCPVRVRELACARRRPKMMVVSRRLTTIADHHR